VPSAAASPPGSSHEAVVTEDGPRPLRELGTVTFRWERRRSRRPCHPRAISSGHQRYAADSHGHSKTTVALGASSLTWHVGGGRNCMACKCSRLVPLAVDLPNEDAPTPMNRVNKPVEGSSLPRPQAHPVLC
jgi:hypothetical protein